MYKIDNHQDQLYSIGNSIQYSVINYEKRILKRVNISISLCYIPETNTMLENNYTPIKKKNNLWKIPLRNTLPLDKIFVISSRDYILRGHFTWPVYYETNCLKDNIKLGQVGKGNEFKW